MPAPQPTTVMSALAALKGEGIDPEPYFAIVADTLIGRHGAEALAFADIAIDRMRTLGDTEGLELWHEVQAALRQRVTDSASPATPFIH